MLYNKIYDWDLNSSDQSLVRQGSFNLYPITYANGVIFFDKKACVMGYV